MSFMYCAKCNVPTWRKRTRQKRTPRVPRPLLQRRHVALPFICIRHRPLRSLWLSGFSPCSSFTIRFLAMYTQCSLPSCSENDTELKIVRLNDFNVVRAAHVQSFLNVIDFFVDCNADLFIHAFRAFRPITNATCIAFRQLSSITRITCY